MLSENPKISIRARVAISETGIAIVGMMVVRQLCRKTKTTRTTSPSASPNVTTTSRIEAETNRVVSYRMPYLIPAGKRFDSSSILDLMFC